MRGFRVVRHSAGSAVATALSTLRIVSLGHDLETDQQLLDAALFVLKSEAYDSLSTDEQLLAVSRAIAATHNVLNKLRAHVERTAIHWRTPTDDGIEEPGPATIIAFTRLALRRRQFTEVIAPRAAALLDILAAEPQEELTDQIRSAFRGAVRPTDVFVASMEASLKRARGAH